MYIANKVTFKELIRQILRVTKIKILHFFFVEPCQVSTKNVRDLHPFSFFFTLLFGFFIKKETSKIDQDNDVKHVFVCKIEVKLIKQAKFSSVWYIQFFNGSSKPVSCFFPPSSNYLYMKKL